LKSYSSLPIISTSQLALFGPLAWWVHFHPVLSIDVRITHAVQKNQSPILDYGSLALDYIGTYKLLTPMAIPVAAVFWVLRLRLEGVMLAGISLASTLLRTILQHLVNRPRPSPVLVQVKKKSHSKSFPSGHVIASLSFWGWLFTLGMMSSKQMRPWQKSLLTIPALIIVLVGPSRIYLGDHWASDVLGSYLIGGVLLGITLWIYLKLKERGVLETERARNRSLTSQRFRSFSRK